MVISLNTVFNISGNIKSHQNIFEFSHYSPKHFRELKIIQPMTMEEGEMGDELKVDEVTLEEVPSNHDRYGDSCMIRFLKISSADPIKPISTIAVPIICMQEIFKDKSEDSLQLLIILFRLRMTYLCQIWSWHDFDVWRFV